MEEELEEWPPPEARVRSGLWRAEGHLERREYHAAFRALTDVLPATSSSERELVLGLRHLAAAGYKSQEGDRTRALRQLAHARRRIAGVPPVYEEIELSSLLELVEADVQS